MGNHFTCQEQNRQRELKGGKIGGKCRLRLWLYVTMFCLGIPLWAQQSRVYRDGNSWVEELSGNMASARSLRLITDLGSVQVQGNAPRLSYVVRKHSSMPTEEMARREFEQMRVSAAKFGDSVSIEGKINTRGLNGFGADFIVMVPHDVGTVKVETHMGSLAFHSIAATIVAKTGAGLIKLDDLAGPVTIVSGGGNVEAGSLGSGHTLATGPTDVRVSKVGGQTQLSVGGGPVYIGSPRASTIETGAGSIQIQKCVGDLHVVSGGGNLYLGDVDGSVQAETEGGSVRLASASGPVRVTTGGGSVELYKLGRGAQVETGAGPITVEFLGNHGFMDSLLHTAAGDVTVCFSSGLPLTVHANTDMATGRGILSDFPGLNISEMKGQFAPRSVSAEGALNGGGPALRIRTTMGQIAFRRCP